MKAEHAWQAALGELQRQMPKADFNAWVQHLRLLEHRNGQFVFGVANEYARDWLAERLTTRLAELLAEHLEHPVAVRFVVAAGPARAVDAQAAWEEAQALLARLTDPADYATWIAPARGLDYADGAFTIGAPNPAGRDWLARHLQSRAENLLEAILERPVEVVFTLAEAEAPTSEPAAPGEREMILEVVRQDLREAYTRPDQVHVMPAYLLRWLPYASAAHFLTLIAFRQAMYRDRQGAVRENVPFSASLRGVAALIGADKNTILAHRDSWLLRWFLRHLPNDQYTFHPESGQVRRQADRYTFLATTPLTPGDQDALQNWLLEHGVGSDPLSALKEALAAPADQILPYPAPEPSALQKRRPPSDHNRSFNQLFLDLCPPDLDEAALAEALDLASQLRARLVGSDRLAFVPLYFLRHWVPLVGSGAAAAILVCRQRVYANPDTGEVREAFRLEGGLAALSRLSGLGPSTLRRMLPLPDKRRRGRRAGRKPGLDTEGDRRASQRAARRLERRRLVSHIIYRLKKAGDGDLLVWARKADPLTPAHRADYQAANQWLAHFLARHPHGFGPAHVDAFVGALRAQGVFAGAAAVPPDEGEEPDQPIGGLSDNAIGGLSYKGIGADSDIGIGGFSDKGVGAHADKGDNDFWDQSGQLKYPQIKHLEPITLKNILLPLASTATESGARRAARESWPARVGEGWEQVLPTEELRALTSQRQGPEAAGLDLAALVSHWLHVYSPAGEGLKLPREYVRSRLNAGPYGPTHLRLARLGPKALSDLIRSTEIEAHTGRLVVDPTLPGAEDWRRLMAGTRERARLLELAERLGLLVVGPPGAEA